MDEISALKKDLDSLRVELEAAKEGMKERESSVLRGIRTAIIDFNAYAKGQRDFPKSALIGLIASYLTPRILIVIGSLAAGLGTGLQVWLLFRQNDLIEKQGHMLQSQTKSADFQSRVSLLSMLNTQDPFKSSIALAEAAENPEVVEKTIRALAVSEEHGKLGLVACRLLMDNDKQSVSQFLSTLFALQHRLTLATEGHIRMMDSGKLDRDLPEVEFVSEVARFLSKMLAQYSSSHRAHEFTALKSEAYTRLYHLSYAADSYMKQYAKMDPPGPKYDPNSPAVASVIASAVKIRRERDAKFAAAITEFYAFINGYRIRLPQTSILPLDKVISMMGINQEMDTFLKQFE